MQIDVEHETGKVLEFVVDNINMVTKWNEMKRENQSAFFSDHILLKLGTGYLDGLDATDSQIIFQHLFQR